MIDKKRRQFVTLVGTGAAVLPLSALVTSLPSRAQDLVDPESDQAKALNYMAESDNPDQNCANCTLYQGGDAETGPCPLFAGSAVPAAAWCSAWVAKA